MAKPFTELDILYDLQHGFREKRSCETQLIMLVDELTKNMQMAIMGKQIDLIILDFKDFLDNRKHTVVINSDEVTVSSGVPQGSVLGPIIFLAYTNDCPTRSNPE